MHVSHFLATDRELKFLDVNFAVDLDRGELVDIARMLPGLKQLTAFGAPITAEEAIEIISICPELTVFAGSFCDGGERQRVVAKYIEDHNRTIAISNFVWLHISPSAVRPEWSRFGR